MTDEGSDGKEGENVNLGLGKQMDDEPKLESIDRYVGLHGPTLVS